MMHLPAAVEAELRAAGFTFTRTSANAHLIFHDARGVALTVSRPHGRHARHSAPWRALARLRRDIARAQAQTAPARAQEEA